MGAHLTPLDASFLELEQVDESAHIHIGWAMVFDPLPEGGAPSLEVLRERTVERLGPLHRFRRRLSSPRVGSFSLPTWEPDLDFDIANHMRHASLPPPARHSHLHDLSAAFAETKAVSGMSGSACRNLIGCSFSKTNQHHRRFLRCPSHK